MAQEPQQTDFLRDVLGRYVCNSFQEALESTRGGESPFHYIIIGGGMFGGSLASFLFNLDPASPAFFDPFKRYHSRILVLEAGPLLLPEHEQNLAIGIGVPGPATIAELQPNPADRAKPAPPRNEVWGVPWHSDDGFNGLAYCVGGRSLFWGGWAPRFLESEMPTDGPSPRKWPKRVVEELKAVEETVGDGSKMISIWDDAAHQLGVDDPNDFVNGELHSVMRDFFFENVGAISHMIPISELPDYVDLKKMEKMMGEPPPAEKLRLDAPYAVQSSTRSGFFPFNKFSSVPLMMAAARQAANDALKTGDQVLNNSRKQIMIVPNCHVTRLQTLPVGADRGDIKRVVTVETNQGAMEVAHNAAVILAMGAIEDARLALDSFQGIRSYGHIGKNFMAHLRTNTHFRVPRNIEIGGKKIFASISRDELEISAIQLRGRIHQPDTTQGHFHLQVVASGVPNGKGNADVEIFRKVPDIDQFEMFRQTKDEEVAVAIRGIGEMAPNNEKSEVILDPEKDEFGVQRAFVRINNDFDRQKPAIRNLIEKDVTVLNAMVKATNDVLKLFKVPERPMRSEPPENPMAPVNDGEHIKLDGLGTTYHESGTLRMGDNADDSVVNPDLRFHGVTNAYVTDMSVVPTCGSANPVQPGIALSRRLAKHLAAPKIATEGMFLFEDRPTPFWRMAGAPATSVKFGFGELEATSSRGPFGLYWCTIPTPPDFELSLDWMTSDEKDNSGIFIRFPDPDKPPPGKEQAFLEPGFIAVEYGFEIQIDASEGGDNPKKANGETAEFVDKRFRGTGAIYNEPRQNLLAVPGLVPNQWHTFIIRVKGLTIEVDARVNGGPPQRRTTFTYDSTAYVPDDLRGNPARGRPTPSGAGEAGVKRYIGLQAHNESRLVKFRKIFIKPI
ncbi:MAG TPA: GMC oxidoreductase [Nitrospiraceae bacterium]|nr:GMC oxidoreductase [Nitrospiraceae bacterium]